MKSFNVSILLTLYFACHADKFLEELRGTVTLLNGATSLSNLFNRHRVGKCKRRMIQLYSDKTTRWALWTIELIVAPQSLSVWESQAPGQVNKEVGTLMKQ